MTLNYGPTNSKQRDAAQHVCNCIEIIFIRDQISLYLLCSRYRSFTPSHFLHLVVALNAFVPLYSIVCLLYIKIISLYSVFYLYSLLLLFPLEMKLHVRPCCCWSNASSCYFKRTEKSLDGLTCMKCLVFDIYKNASIGAHFIFTF